MNRWIIRIALCQALAFAFGVALAAAQPGHGGHNHSGERSSDSVLKCPVLGQPIDSALRVATKNGPVFFCCQGCIAKYQADPAKYAAGVAAQRRASAGGHRVQMNVGRSTVKTGEQKALPVKNMVRVKVSPSVVETGERTDVYVTFIVGVGEYVDEPVNPKERQRFLRRQKTRLKNYQARIESVPAGGRVPDRLRKDLFHDAHCECDASCVCQGGNEACGGCGLGDCVTPEGSEGSHNMHGGHQPGHEMKMGKGPGMKQMQHGQKMTGNQEPGMEQMGQGMRGNELVSGKMTDGMLCPDLNICLAIDTSGSMEKETGGKSRLDYAREAAKQVLPHLKRGNYVSVISFSDQVETLVKPEEWTATPDAKNSFERKLVKMPEPWGGTNIFAALQKANEYIKHNKNDTLLSRILLLSDGKDTASGQGLEDFRSLAKGIIASGIDICTFGIGEYDENLMHAISGDPSLSNGGHYHAIKDYTKIQTVMWNCIMQPIELRRVSIRVQLADNVQTVFVGSKMAVEGNGTLFGNLGNIRFDQFKTLVARLSVLSAPPGDHTVGAVDLRYQDMAGVRHTLAPVDIRVSSVEAPPPTLPPTPEVLLQLVRNSYASCVALLDANNKAGALRTIKDAVNVLEQG